jgi:putative phage-type endonuclease
MSSTSETTTAGILVPGSPEWRAQRQTGIGGSDSAAAVRQSPWTTITALYYDKTGEVPLNADNADTRRGTLLEPVVRQLYADATGDYVAEIRRMLRHPKHSFAIANLDGIVTRRDKLLECKTSRSRHGWGEPGSDEIPRPYLCQVQHCMGVAGLPECDVAVLFGDFEFAIYTVAADAEFQELLFEREAEFWSHVERRIPPEPSTAADMLLRWPKSKASTSIGGIVELRAAFVLAEIKQRTKELDSIAERAEAILKLAINDSEGLEIDGELVATWKSSKDSKRFDAKAFAAAHPELHEQFMVETPGSRRFLLKTKASEADILIPPLPANLLNAPLEIGSETDATPAVEVKRATTEAIEPPTDPIVIQSSSTTRRPGRKKTQTTE